MPLFPTLSWEIPRESREIGMITRQAILDQWCIPSIEFPDGLETYEVNETTTSFIVKNYKTQYKVTIQKIEG